MLRSAPRFSSPTRPLLLLLLRRAHASVAPKAQQQLQRSSRSERTSSSKRKGIRTPSVSHLRRDDFLRIPLSPTSPEHPNEDEHLQRLCTHGHFVKAFDTLPHIHTPLCTHTYLCLLKACICKKSLVHAKQVHSHIGQHHINLRSPLVDYLGITFAKCGSIKDALQLYTLPCLTAHSSTAIISVYADSGIGHEAVKMHQRMQEVGVKPTSYTLVSLVKTCGSVQELQYGRILHVYACCEGFLSNAFVGNTLVSMYGKCGSVTDAESMFCSLPQRDDVSWSALLSAYVQQGEGEKALQLFRQMLEEDLPPNQQALVFALQACGNLAEKHGSMFVEGRQYKFALLEIGRAIHAHPHTRAFPLDMFLQTALLTMYSKCGAFEEATDVFHSMSQCDLVAWTSILSVLVEHGEGERALLLYRVMQEEGQSPNQQTFVVALQACGTIARREQAELNGRALKSIALEIGLALHTDACKNGYASDILVGTALVSMYGVCGALVLAEEVFGSLSQCDIVAWNAMLSSYVEQGHGEKALRLYRQMRAEGVSSNPPTFVLALQACGALSRSLEVSTSTGMLNKQICLEILQTLHMDACKKGYMSNVIVGNALLSLYGKYGTVAEAESVFDAVSEHDIASRTAMLSVYVERDQVTKALWLHREMLKEEATLDEVAVVCILQACKEMGMLEVCQRLHFNVVAAGHEQLPSVAVTLIDTYGCGASMEDGDAVFAGLYAPDVLSWTACITGHAGGRDLVASLRMFEKLTLEKLTLDEIVFTSLLSACCHGGLVTQGLEYFHAMRRDYKLLFEPFHYSILVDLLGRAGDLQRVENVLERAPLQCDTTVWLSLLGACVSHGNLELAKQAFDHSIDAQPNQGTAYVIMSNIYANELQEGHNL